VVLPLTFCFMLNFFDDLDMILMVNDDNMMTHDNTMTYDDNMITTKHT